MHCEPVLTSYKDGWLKYDWHIFILATLISALTVATFFIAKIDSLAKRKGSNSWKDKRQ